MSIPPLMTMYRAIVPGISVTAASGAGDLLEIRTPADCIIIPSRAIITTEDEETSQQIAAFLETFATAGTGGVSVTPALLNQHLQASQCVCLRNNTTDATGTTVVVAREGDNLLGPGWRWNGGDGPQVVPISTSLVLGLGAALAVDSVVTAMVEWWEGGQ